MYNMTIKNLIDEIKNDESLGIYEKQKYMKKLETIDPLLESILMKIDSKKVTCDDFNQLIAETTPESIRDRIRRRTLRNVTDDHQDHDGHQSLSLPSATKRVAPKRKPIHQQNHGRGKLGHQHSTRTQRRIAEALQYIKDSWDKEIIETYSDVSMLNQIICKLLTKPDINRDRLNRLLVK